MITRLHSNARMSQVVSFPLAGEMVVLAGQVAKTQRDGDTAAQAKEILENIDQLLADAGTDKKAVVSAYVWLTDMADFAAFNTVWDAWVPAGHAPARACVEAKLAAPELSVEIQVIAVKS